MIARIWHGKTSIKKYDVYTEFLKQVAIPDYQKIAGLKGLVFLRNIINNEGHFYLIRHSLSLECRMSRRKESRERLSRSSDRRCLGSQPDFSCHRSKREDRTCRIWKGWRHQQDSLRYAERKPIPRALPTH